MTDVWVIITMMLLCYANTIYYHVEEDKGLS